jgi:hypothetical protein
LLTAPNACWAATGKIHKVLPLFLDLNGQFTVSPSLSTVMPTRHSCEAIRNCEVECSTTTLEIAGKAAQPLVLRVELRGMAKGDLPKQTTLEKAVKTSGWFGTWTGLRLQGAEFHDFGEVTAWRVTLWEGDTLLDSMQSFLW